MVKDYSNMTKEEFITRIAELEDKLLAAWEAMAGRFGGAHRVGRYKGWVASQGWPSVLSAMSELVRAGYWQWHPKNNRYARPIETKEAGK